MLRFTEFFTCVEQLACVNADVDGAYRPLVGAAPGHPRTSATPYRQQPTDAMMHQDLPDVGERQLPLRVALHSHLSGSEVTAAEDEVADEGVWRVPGCRTWV